MSDAPGFHFIPAVLSGVPTQPSYLASLTSPIDSFLEDHIANSEFHRIVLNDEDIGHCAMHGGKLLTQFHLLRHARRFGTPLLAEVRQRFNPMAAFVPTCDEFFLSHAVEDYAHLEKQACFFVEADPTSALPTLRAGLVYRRAEQKDTEVIVAMCGDFLDNYAGRIADRQVHVGWLDGALVALGIIERSKLFPGQASIGMFISQLHRQIGLGTSTLVHMRTVCRDEGLRAVAGCWYYNHLSRKTLEAAGMVTTTRLLRFDFTGKSNP